MELLLLFMDKIVVLPKLSKHVVGTQKARTTTTHFLLKFWSEFNDCRMQLQSGGTPGCVRVYCWRITFQIFTMYNVGSKLFRQN